MLSSSVADWKSLSPLQRLVIFLNFLFGLSRGIVIPFLFLELKSRYAATLTAISVLVTLSIVFRVVGSIIGGMGADRFSKRSLVAGGAFFNSLCYLALAVKSNFYVAGAIYLAINLAQAIFRTVFSSTIGESLKKEYTRVAYAFFHASQNLAIGLGALVGAYALSKSAASIYLICFSALLAFAISAWHSPIFKKLALAPRAEVKAASFASLLSVPRLIVCLVSLNLVLVLSYGVFNEILGVIFDAAHISVKNVGLLFAINSAMIVLFQIPVAGKIKHWSFSRLIVSSLSFFLLYFAAIAMIFQGQALWWATVAVVFFSCGEMLHVSVINAEVNSACDTSNRGKSFGYLNASWSAGFGLGPAIVAAISERNGFAVASVAMLFITLFATLLLLSLVNKQRSQKLAYA